jgi:hypothetical protein
MAVLAERDYGGEAMSGMQWAFWVILLEVTGTAAVLMWVMAVKTMIALHRKPQEPTAD